MCGDLYSRTGNVDDRVQGNVFNLFANSRTNCENTYLGDKISFCRANKDKICNKYGLMLLSLCKTSNLLIVNGRIGNDSCGNLTFCNISTIDYFLCSPSLFQQIHNFAVNLLNPMISDGHCVLQLVFKPVQKIKNMPTVVNEEATKTIVRWDPTENRNSKHNWLVIVTVLMC